MGGSSTSPFGSTLVEMLTRLRKWNENAQRDLSFFGNLKEQAETARLTMLRVLALPLVCAAALARQVDLPFTVLSVTPSTSMASTHTQTSAVSLSGKECATPQRRLLQLKPAFCSELDLDTRLPLALHQGAYAHLLRSGHSARRGFWTGCSPLCVDAIHAHASG